MTALGLSGVLDVRVVLDLLPAFARRRISLRSSTSHLLFFGIGAAVAVCASLCLTPVANYAAAAKQHEVAPEPSLQSLSGAPAFATKQMASMDQGQHAPVVAVRHISTDVFASRPAKYHGPMVRLSGHVLPALARAKRAWTRCARQGCGGQSAATVDGYP